MSDLHMAGIKPPDDDWLKHKRVWDACEAAGVEIPDETDCFFDNEAPDPDGVVVELGGDGEHASGPARRWTDGDASAGIEIDVADIPDGVKTIRVFQMW